MHKLAKTFEIRYWARYKGCYRTATGYECACGQRFEDTAMAYFDARAHIPEKGWPKPSGEKVSASARKALGI